MALTKTPIELSSTPGIVDNSNATAITIDSSENVLVGKTATTYATEGAMFEKGSALELTTDSGRVLRVHRTTNDGNIIEFSKDSATVGSIGSRSGVVSYIVLDPRSGVKGAALIGGSIDANEGVINPGKADGDIADAAISFGTASSRFKDIYLSGGVNFSANANAGGMTSELLDDYEEGAWTPAFNAIGTGTYALQVGRYTKVGNLVTAHFHLDINVLGTASGHLIITGLPFTASSVPANYGSMTTAHASGWSGAFTNLGGLVNPGTATFPVYYQDSSGVTAAATHAQLQVGNFLGTIIYEAA